MVFNGWLNNYIKFNYILISIVLKYNLKDNLKVLDKFIKNFLYLLFIV